MTSFAFRADSALAGLGGDTSPWSPADRPAPRQRSKLWELNGSFHCSIIGTCLTTAELRRTMGKLEGIDVSGLTDHELHSRAVALCDKHNISAKLLQKALDHRHETVIKRFGRVRGEAAVMELWAEARRAGDIPGAYWAVLTHPDVGQTGLRRAFGDVHMLSHLVGAANRADIRRLAALEEENAALREKVERQQTRLHDAVTSRDATIRQLGALVARDAPVSPETNDDALTALRHVVGDLEARLAREIGRRERVEQRLAEVSTVARRNERRAVEAEAERDALRREIFALERHDDPIPSQTVLPALRILYVGGRPSSVDQMREALAASGGALLSHDGGIEDHPSLLPGLIGQADRVVFPVDRVSHDAALTVKRLCRQLEKPFFPLRSSGVSSFLAAMAEPVGAAQGNEVSP